MDEDATVSVTTVVMVGLVPAIHVFRLHYQDVDARDKPGHDGLNEWLRPLHLMPREDVAHLCDEITHGYHLLSRRLFLQILVAIGNIRPD